MPAQNPFTHYSMTPAPVALNLVVITPDDNNDLLTAIRQIRVGGSAGGDVVVVTLAGTTVTFKNTFAGEILGPFCVARVKATGTTATDLVGYI